MTNYELLMLKCMVESLESTTSNEYLYATSDSRVVSLAGSDSVSIVSCREWLNYELYKKVRGE